MIEKLTQDLAKENFTLKITQEFSTHYKCSLSKSGISVDVTVKKDDKFELRKNVLIYTFEMYKKLKKLD